LTAYFMWMKDVRSDYESDIKFSSLKAKEKAKKFGKGWRDLSEATKNEYKAEAKHKMQKWKEQMIEYKKTDSHKSWSKQNHDSS